MLKQAELLIGQPYKYGYCFNDEQGGDCTGLVDNVLNNAKPGYSTPIRYSTPTLRTSGFLQPNKYDFKQGDILLFKPTPKEAAEGSTGHAGIVYNIGGNGNTISMIHSAVIGWNPGTPDGVQITNDIWGEEKPGAYNDYWINQYEGYIPYEKLLTKKK
jgi:hypothetical protein